MESIYGPPPGARQPRRRGAGKEPSWRKALRVTGLVIVGFGAFVLLVWLEVESGGGDDDDDPLYRLQQLQFNVPPYNPIVFDPSLFEVPVFKPLQSAEIIPASAIHPAETRAMPAPKRLQTAGIISR